MMYISKIDVVVVPLPYWITISTSGPVFGIFGLSKNVLVTHALGEI